MQLKIVAMYLAVVLPGSGLYFWSPIVPAEEQQNVMQQSLGYIKLTEHIAAAPQIQPEHMQAIAAAGYAVVVNNRPDGEAPDQPTSAALQAAAEAAGLEYHYYPIDAFNYPGNDLAAITALFDDSERPVFAFCRSGTRSTNLWISSRDPSERLSASEHARQLGFDVSMSQR